MWIVSESEMPWRAAWSSSKSKKYLIARGTGWLVLRITVNRSSTNFCSVPYRKTKTEQVHLARDIQELVWVWLLFYVFVFWLCEYVFVGIPSLTVAVWDRFLVWSWLALVLLNCLVCVWVTLAPRWPSLDATASLLPRLHPLAWVSLHGSKKSIYSSVEYRDHNKNGSYVLKKKHTFIHWLISHTCSMCYSKATITFLKDLNTNEIFSTFYNPFSHEVNLCFEHFVFQLFFFCRKRQQGCFSSFPYFK